MNFLQDKMCMTRSSGPNPNKMCIFPFKHLGITYNYCTITGAYISRTDLNTKWLSFIFSAI